MDTPIDVQKTDTLKKPTAALKAYSEGAADTITEGYQTGLAWVKKNPLQAAAIGVGVGFAVGVIVRKLGERRSS